MRTLRNAVARGMVHHAYLFVGSRGTGKTSMAKILAACLNCERGPTVEPCGQCDSCVSIARATSLDVIEMDAASNNSVDDIRELRDSVAYAPVSGRRKVYILDEAHMLSTAAWNAFLKTLEEPPPNTVFVLATTEANKVPATVVDRCHRFDFHRPTVEQIASVVRRAAQAEAIEIPPAAVAALARSATGSFRDALGTLEQIVTYCGPQIALEDVLAVLGVADARLLEETIDAVAGGDAAHALRALEECVEQGRDAASFAADLEVRARELLVVQVLEQVPPELALTPEADGALSEQAARVDHATVVRLLELLGEAMAGVRAGADARTRLELALVKAARPEVDGSMRALLARLERLERGAASEVGDDDELKGPPAAARSHRAQREEARVMGARPDGDTPATGAGRPGDPPGDANAGAPSAIPPVDASAVDASAADAPIDVSVADAPAVDASAADASAADASAADVPAADVPAADVSVVDAPAASRSVVWDVASVCSVWPAVVDLVRSTNALLGACIDEARPVAVDGEELTLAYPFAAAFYKKKAEDPANRAAVGEALGALMGGRWRLRYELRDVPEPADRVLAGGQSEAELVARFMDEFDAEEISDERADQRGAQAMTSNEKGV